MSPSDEEPERSVDGSSPAEQETLLTPAANSDKANPSGLISALPAETQLMPPAPRSAIRLSTGQVLSERFQILRFISSGGMGDVYEAQDLVLRERVALKTIRSDIASSEEAVERFKREIYLARKVTHPNVCRIFDFARDQNAEQGEVLFLTMELLAGETLSKRLRSSRRMSTEEALPIVLQMTAALSAAHDAGIVHRDFKCANVILVPAGETPRAVVTDFGLARGKDGESGLLDSLTNVGRVVGTPDYMAPEQLEGDAITAATDIYALGVVMYEMVTGAVPFTGENAWVVANKRLKENAPSPRTQVPALDPRWEKAILRCLERRPEDRFASAAEVAAFLQGEVVAPSRKLKRRRAVIAGGAVAAAVAGLAIYLLVAKHVEARRSVAVLEFKNIAERPEAAWVATGLEEGLRSELAAAGKLRTISGQEVAEFKRDSGVKDFDSLSKSTLNQLHRLGADLVVTGSYTDLGKDSDGRIHLNIAIQDAARGETVDSISADGAEKDISALVSQTGARLRAKLGLGELSPEKETALAVSQPNAEAAPLYSQGVSQLRNYNAAQARDLLEKSIAVDPNYPFSHAALAQAWSILGYDSRAKDEAKKALDLSGKLSLEDRLLIEGRYREMASDWKGAIDSYGELYEHFPDNLEYGLRLAHAQSSDGNPQAALATLAILQNLPPPRGDDPSIDLERAEILSSTGDFKGAQTAALAAIEGAKTRGAKLLQARSLIWVCSAWRKSGDLGKAKAACGQAVQIDSTLADKLGMARSVNGLAMIESDQGNVGEALKGFNTAFRISREIGAQRDMAGALNNMAMLKSGQGNLPESRQEYEQALVIQHEIGAKTEQANTLGNLADLARQEGDSAKAQREYEEAVAIARQSGDRESLAFGLNNLGGILFGRGDPLAAADKYREALSLRQQMGAKGEIASTLANLGEFYLARADLDRAEKAYRDALKLQEEIGDKSWAASSKLGLANVLLERGQSEAAAALGRSALDEFHSEHDIEDDIQSHILLARCLLARQRYADAQHETQLAADEGKAIQDESIKIRLRTVQAQALAGSGSNAARQNALKELRRTIAGAGKSGAAGALLTARLALAEMEYGDGSKSTARADAGKLNQDASRQGFLLIAQQAQRLAEGS